MSQQDPEYRTTYKKLASGRTKIYYYTKPGGTRFFDVMDKPIEPPFSDAFHRAYRLALDTEAPKLEGDCAQMIVDFLESHRFASLSAATQEGYRRDLGDARNRFGTASARVMEDRRFRGKVIAWQAEIANRSPRRADLCVVALRAAFEYARDRGALDRNPAAGIKPIYKSKDDKRPWSAQEIAIFLCDRPQTIEGRKVPGCPQDVSDIFRLAMYTALRRTDLAEITWDAWKGSHIQWQTSKGRGRRTAVIPLTADAQAFLHDLKRRQAGSPHGLQRTMLVGASGRSMTPSTVGKKVNKRADALGIDNTLHRHRNTYATLLVKADFEPREIAGIMGWSIDQVHELIRIYVKQDVIVAAQVARLTDRPRNE